MVEAPQTRYTRAQDGVALAYQVWGDGPVDILALVPAGCIDCLWEDAAYTHVLRRLGGVGRLIVFDYRGTGSSGPMPGGRYPTFEEWIDDVRAVLDAAGASQVVVVGTSLGGLEAMVFAAIHPERVARLILVGATARVSWAPDYPIGTPLQDLDAMIEAIPQHWGTGVDAAAYVPSRAGDPAFCEWFGRIERLIMSPPEAARLNDWGLRQIDARAVLSSLQVPTLVIIFAEDPAQSAYLVEHIPGAEAVTVPVGQQMDWLFNVPIGELVLQHIEPAITGAPAAPTYDRQLATVLFTDIVGSTGAAAQFGDSRWSQLLDDHDAIVQRELDRHRGRQIKNTGDGVLAIFDGPARAVRCAKTIASSVPGLGIEIRAGLHAGEVELRGEDISGIAVHIAARISGLAEPAEVLVSSTVKDLAAGSGLTFADRGEHHLKGIPEPWRIFALEPSITTT